MSAPSPPPKPKKKQIRVKPSRNERRCPLCKRIFVWRRPERLYCSTNCRVKSWNARQRKAPSSPS